MLCAAAKVTVEPFLFSLIAEVQNELHAARLRITSVIVYGHRPLGKLTISDGWSLPG